MHHARRTGGARNSSAIAGRSPMSSRSNESRMRGSTDRAAPASGSDRSSRSGCRDRPPMAIGQQRCETWKPMNPAAPVTRIGPAERVGHRRLIQAGDRRRRGRTRQKTRAGLFGSGDPGTSRQLATVKSQPSITVATFRNRPVKRDRNSTLEAPRPPSYLKSNVSPLCQSSESPRSGDQGTRCVPAPSRSTLSVAVAHEAPGDVRPDEASRLSDDNRPSGIAHGGVRSRAA